MAHARCMPLAVWVALLGISLIHADRDVEKDAEGVKLDVHSFQKVHSERKVSKHQFTKLSFEKLRMGGSAGFPNVCSDSVWHHMDTDHSMYIEPGEWTAIFNQIETDGYADVDETEWKGWLGPNCDDHDGASTFYAMDFAADGLVDTDEWDEARSSLIDRNGDDHVDQAEWNWFFFNSGLAGDYAMAFHDNSRAALLQNVAKNVRLMGPVPPKSS